MKRIVILCDGTWNRSDSTHPTNVIRLAQMMNGIDALGIVQVPIYVQGVGTGEGVTEVARWQDKILGGMLGWGLMENVVEAYRHLVFLYEPGDEVFIFGFSRGAYTARSLTGFIRATGIVSRDDLNLIPKGVERYRTRNRKSHNPRTDESSEFRARTMRSRVATSTGEQAWRRENAEPEVPLFEIAYLGVWDSVGALGVPRYIPFIGSLRAHKYEFHDADLSSMVTSARHAVAIDERRRAFEPTLWANIDDLNAKADCGNGPLYQELYFAGDHGSIGGGGDITALSSIALRWIVEGAQQQKLSFSQKKLQDLEDEEDPLGPLHNKSTPLGWPERLMRLWPKDREGPPTPDRLHDAARTRWGTVAATPGFRPYRPGPLAGLEQELALLFPTDGGDADLSRRA